MLLNNIKIIFRQFRNRKSYVLINLSGLTIGLAAALLIGMYVMNEWTTDAFIPHQERTFRLLRTSEINLEPYRIGVTSAPFATAIKEDYPDDVEEVTRVLDGNSLVTIGDQSFEEANYFYVDSNFVSFFNLPLLYGNPQTALSEANRIILSESTAEKYFGTASAAMGQTLKIDDSYDAVVSGVFDKMAYQSHMEFDLVESNQALYGFRFWKDWWSNSMVTYLRLAPNVSAQNFDSRLPDFMEKYFGDDFKRTGAKVGLTLEPVKEIYFASETRYDPVQHGNKSGVLLFFFAAVFLIIVASINYINLSTATAITRSKEMAVHQLLGSGKGRIIKQILTESTILTVIAMAIALQLTRMAIPWFEGLLDTSFTFELVYWKLGLMIIAIGAIVSLASGLYPGLLMASFKPSDTLKGHSLSGNQASGNLRKGLVVFQYALSTLLLCSTFIIYQQLNYLNQKNLGFDKEHVIVVRINNSEIRQQKGFFKNEVLREPGVSEVSFLSSIPGGFHDATTVDIPAFQKNMRMRTAFVDFNYVQTMGLDLTAGRNLNGKLSSDTTQAVLLNEQAVKDIGTTTEQILGQTLFLSSFDSIPKKVVGILKDFHFTSLHDKIEPLVVSYGNFGGTIAIKTRGDRLKETIATTEAAWMKVAPAFPFNYTFLDESLANQYASEVKQGHVFAFFAGIAIFIACLGIFGLAAFSASLRTKEIGVRKVLGASVAGIIGLLTKDFLKLVLIACVIATPFAWYLMQQWLEGFAYKIEMAWWVFVLAGLMGLLVSFLTVSVHSIRAALSNPVDSLRSE